MIVKLKYLSRERSGLFLYFRQIPADLRRHYQGRILRRQSLKTHDPSIAAKEALRLAQLDDKIWASLRNGAPDIDTARASSIQTVDLAMIRGLLQVREGPRFSAALREYLRKNQGRDERFIYFANRAFATVKDTLGDRPLSKIKRSDARAVLDSLLGAGLKTASVRRYIATLSAIMNAGIQELELDLKNPFAALSIPHFLEDAKTIPSLSEVELMQIAAAGLTQKTEQGLIATMQIETGCRVAEIAALRTGDVHIDAPVPHVCIVQHLEHSRRLKTGKASERTLPLIGCTLAAARLALASADGGWIFPKINKKNPSDAVNVWLRKVLGGKPGSHMARHTLETRLILAKIDQRLIDSVLGHKLRGQGAAYFSGFGLADLAAAIEKVAIR
jgi:integrase